MDLPNRRQPTPPLQRRSIRLPDYDYSTCGYYFVTLCTAQRRPSFGAIVDGALVPTPLGRLVEEELKRLPCHHPTVAIDTAVVMPNHWHGIVDLGLAGVDRGESLGQVINHFKGAVARRARRELAWSGPVWQRGYYEHVIRNHRSLMALREYIVLNPVQWELDKYYATL